MRLALCLLANSTNKTIKIYPVKFFEENERSEFNRDNLNDLNDPNHLNNLNDLNDPMLYRHSPTIPRMEQINMERRKHPRFRTQDNCYAVLRGNYSKVGRICDISLNGLSFRYLGEEKEDKDCSHIDIFLVKNGFYLHSMPCKIIYEIEDESFGKGFITRMLRSGVQFLEATKSQSEQLDHFMQTYTIG